MLLASALAAHRMARDNELTAMRAAGLSWWRILRPVWAVGFLASGLSLGIAEYIQPYADRRAEAIKLDVAMARKTLALQPGKFIGLTPELYALPGEVDDREGTIHDLKLFFVDPKGDARASVTLVEADIATLKDDQLILDQPMLHGINDIGEAPRMVVNLPETIKEFAGELRRQENLSIVEIAKQLDAQGDQSAQATAPLVFQLHHRLSMALACLAFSLLGAPMTLVFRGGASIGGVLAAILFAFAYYVGMLWARDAGLNGAMPAVLAAWLPTGLTAAIGAVLLWRRY